VREREREKEKEYIWGGGVEYGGEEMRLALMKIRLNTDFS
jgi:hypothetical protein